MRPEPRQLPAQRPPSVDAPSRPLPLEDLLAWYDRAETAVARAQAAVRETLGDGPAIRALTRAPGVPLHSPRGPLPERAALPGHLEDRPALRAVLSIRAAARTRAYAASLLLASGLPPERWSTVGAEALYLQTDPAGLSNWRLYRVPVACAEVAQPGEHPQATAARHEALQLSKRRLRVLARALVALAAILIPLICWAAW